MARGPLHIYYHMYLSSLGVWTEGGALSLCPLALALAKTDMWEGHAGQTQANPFGFHLVVCMSPCYLGSRYSSSADRICAQRGNLGYLRSRFRKLATTVALLTPEHRATYQFFPSLPSPIDMLVVTFTLFVCTIRPVDVLVMWV